MLNWVFEKRIVRRDKYVPYSTRGRITLAKIIQAEREYVEAEERLKEVLRKIKGGYYGPEAR